MFWWEWIVLLGICLVGLRCALQLQYRQSWLALAKYRELDIKIQQLQIANPNSPAIRLAQCEQDFLWRSMLRRHQLLARPQD
jgi:hypothetical protein